jgi:predicted nucleic acid-binding protein
MPSLVIADTSCLIILDKIDEISILHKVYDETITTPEVLSEYGKPLPDWIIIESVKDIKYQKFIETQLDLGESSAIALAAEKGDCLLILDDLKARRVAKRLGFKFTGTLGILNKAKEKGIINKITPYIDKLKKTDFRISNRVMVDLLKRNNE